MSPISLPRRVCGPPPASRRRSTAPALSSRPARTNVASTLLAHSACSLAYCACALNHARLPRFPVHAHTHTCYPILRPRSLAHTFSALYYLTAPRHAARHLSSPTAAHPPTAAAQIFGRLAFCFTLRAPSSLSPFSSPHLAARRCTHSTRHARITPTYRPTSARCRPRCTPRWVCKIWRRCVSAAYRRFPIPPRLPPSFVPPRSLAYPNAPEIHSL